MIKFYYTGSSSTCRKAKAWLLDNQLPFKEIHLKKDHITREDFLHILSLTENGVDDIVSKQGKTYKALQVDFNTLTLNETFDLFDTYPTLMRKPVVVDEKRLIIGYNNDEIRKFIPRKIREVQRCLILDDPKNA